MENGFADELDSVLRTREFTNEGLAALIRSPRTGKAFDTSHISRLRRAKAKPSPYLLDELQRVLGPEAGARLRLARDWDKTPASIRAKMLAGGGRVDVPVSQSEAADLTKIIKLMRQLDWKEALGAIVGKLTDLGATLPPNAESRSA